MIQFVGSSLTIRDEKTPPRGPWTKERLEIRDMIPGGSTQDADVEYCIVGDRIFLSALVRCKKSEFEELFGFRPGKFKMRKCISVDLLSVAINSVTYSNNNA